MSGRWLNGLKPVVLIARAAFVRNLLQDRQGRAIVQTIIAMAKSLGLRVIAEGIEEASQADKLLAMGCGQGQGYYYGHAEPADCSHCV
ncbi:MAG: EAL domain-containing protein [Methylovulum sp.]|nr:EAL domain-containing protein [Methylovulum sp.]